MVTTDDENNNNKEEEEQKQDQIAMLWVAVVDLQERMRKVERKLESKQ